ncbi:MAG TPA: peptidoglycan-binding domain-containing protein [Casimicrobiaceae bacterium]
MNIRTACAIATLCLCTSCATWGEMDRSEKGTAVGATTGGVVGAAVGGPIGAAVGAGVGGYTGHYEGFGRPAQADTAANGANIGYDAHVERVQQSLKEKGYDPGTIDGRWGPSTESALRQYQQANSLPQTGMLDDQTMSSLGVAK